MAYNSLMHFERTQQAQAATQLSLSLRKYRALSGKFWL